MSHAQKILYAKPNAVSLPPGGITRDAPRPKHLQDPTYEEKFDSTTVFYDVVLVGEDILLSGPPLLNLEGPITRSEVKVDGQIASFQKTQRLERSQTTVFTLEQEPTHDIVEFSFRAEELDLVFEAQLDLKVNKVLQGSRVLMTLQKNENLAWIKDWAHFYAVNHDVNAVVVYNNNTDEYTPEQLASAIAEVEEIDHIVVVDWRFKYGPQGSPWVGPGVAWDSDFCQIGALQNCRFKWGLYAAGWINADVDELMVPVGSRTIFEELGESSSGVVGVNGEWISNQSVGLERDVLPRCWNFPYFTGQKCNPKWAMVSDRVDPDAHPTAHYVRHVDAMSSGEFLLAHFKPLNSGWKIPGRKKTDSRPRPEPLTYAELHLLKSLAKISQQDNARTSLQTAVERSLRSMGVDFDDQTAPVLPWLFSILNVAPGLSRVWEKRWVWKSNVFVLEYPGRETDIAFDLVQKGEKLSLSASVRNPEFADSFKQTLFKEFGEGLGPEKPGKLGFEILSAPIQSDWDYLLGGVSDSIERVLSHVPRYTSVSFLKQKMNTITRRKEPLENLRTEPEYQWLADVIKERASGKQILYVPNIGNWGDALIHEGTKQFLQHFDIEGQIVHWQDLKLWLKDTARLGIELNSVLVLNGGGGSWRNAKSGNRSRAEALSEIFGSIIELPHTYFAPELQTQGCEVEYFSRDKSTSMSHVPSSTYCPDMAFFLQLPDLTKSVHARGDGFFLRRDSERNRALGDLYKRGIDLAQYGNETSNIVPFFEILNGYSQIYTDQLHVGVAAAMLGKRTTLISSNSSENRDIYDATIKHNYPNVEFAELG
ncbi:hypothetical protein [Corynebacterium coyleae]|uniref:hypothetical protein n=1 Tax=Corynebacterium coyleae TaxID=53374 RepID=UPI00254DA694|nr:hypothetical protein [Corynebacterium coyleae]MDK8823370.1 hypothetical protein [Corynebacterium coyleae]